MIVSAVVNNPQLKAPLRSLGELALLESVISINTKSVQCGTTLTCEISRYLNNCNHGAEFGDFNDWELIWIFQTCQFWGW